MKSIERRICRLEQQHKNACLKKRLSPEQRRHVDQLVDNLQSLPFSDYKSIIEGALHTDVTSEKGSL